MRSLLLSIVTTVLLLAGIVPYTASCSRCGNGTDSVRSEQAIRTDTVARIVMEVNKQARLYTTEAVIHKLVTYSDAPSLEGQIVGIPVKVPTRVGDRKIAIPIDVTLKAYIDFAQFDSRNVECRDGKIVITLPYPCLVATASKIDHQGTRQYIGPLRSRFSDAEKAALAKQGMDSILNHTAQYGLTEQARQDATTLLVPLLERMGFDKQHIVIRFRKDFSDKDLLPLIQKL